MEIFRLAKLTWILLADISFSAPRKDGIRYWIDIDAPLSGGFLYHVSRVEVRRSAAFR